MIEVIDNFIQAEMVYHPLRALHSFIKMNDTIDFRNGNDQHIAIIIRVIQRMTLLTKSMRSMFDKNGFQ